MFKSVKSFAWDGRNDIEDGDAGHRLHHIMKANNPVPYFSLIGFPCDLGVQANKGRTGASKGPNAIRESLANIAWHSDKTIQDLGDIVVNSKLQTAQMEYTNAVATCLSKGEKVIAIGGGHEIAWGSYKGLFSSIPLQENKRIGIINFDAHFDLRKCSPSASSGTPFRQISEHCYEHEIDFHYCCLGIAETANTRALFDYANATNTLYLLDYACELDTAKKMLEDMLVNIDELYLTICLDAFPSYIAPGVSAPNTFGISHQFVISIIKWLSQQQKELDFQWRISDIAEMNPKFDIDNRTSKLAARLIYELAMAM